MEPSGDHPSSEFKYDAFISYSHEDSDWVSRELLPSLKERGILFIIDTEFDIGKTIDENIANAIGQSRHTVVVLSAEWVRSAWSNFELGLAGTSDPAARNQRVLPILLSDCEAPPRLRILTYGDFRSTENYSRELNRLLKALKGRDGSASDLGVVNSGPARRGLIALHELLNNPEIRSAASEFRSAFGGTYARIDPVVKYKRMHDLLHQLEFACYNRIKNNLMRFADPNDDFGYQEMASCQSALEAVVKDIRGTASEPVFEGINTAWVPELTRSCSTLASAIDTREVLDVQKVIEVMRRVLSRRPAQINSYLVEAARSLRLRDLVTAMNRLHTKLVTLDADSVRAEEFRRGVMALDELATRLERLIRIHTLWQEIDDELQPVEAVLADSIATGDFSWWQNLKELTANLLLAHSQLASPPPATDPDRSPEAKSADRLDNSQELQESTGRLDGAIVEGGPNGIKASFWRFQRLAKSTFRDTDEALKRQCDELPDLFSPLKTVEEVLR